MSYATNSMASAVERNAPAPMGRTQSARLRVDELLTALEAEVSALRERLDIALSKEPPPEKANATITGGTVHELHGWTTAVGDRIDRITEAVIDLKVRIDL